MNKYHCVQIAKISELRFFRSGPTNVHHCRTFLLALAGLSCYCPATVFLAFELKIM